MSTLVENLALSDYVITSVDIDGMMRFLGIADQVPNGDTVIVDGIEVDAKPGDIITWDGRKWIWDGEKWSEFGNCGSSEIGGGGSGGGASGIGGGGTGGDYSEDDQLSNAMYFPGGVGTKDKPYVMKAVTGMMYQQSTHNFVYQYVELSLINGCVVAASAPIQAIAFTAVQHDPEK